MKYFGTGNKLFAEMGDRRVCVAQLPDELKITSVVDVVRVRATGRTFFFEPSTGALWEDTVSSGR